VVAQRGPVEIQRIHRPDDRVRIAFVQPPLIGVEIAHRIALEEIAIVKQQRVRNLGSSLFDQRCCFRQTDRVVGPVSVIIVGMNVNVHIGRFQ